MRINEFCEIRENNHRGGPMLALAVRSAAAGRLLAQGTRRLVATRSSRLDNGAAQHEATDDGQPSHAHAAQPGGNERARPSAAELGRTRELLGQMLPPSARPAYTLDELVGSAYRLSATALQVCKLPAFLQLCAPRAAAASNWRQRWLLLEGPPRSELLQERLARALAHDLGAHFLMVRLDGLAAAASPAEQGGGRARGDGRANGNRAQVRKVAELARELEELTDELSDVMHDDGLAVADARIDATLAAAAAAAFQSHRRDGAAAAADAADAAEVQTALASLLEGAAPAAPAGPLVHELVLSLEADALQAEVRALRAVVAGARAPLLICLHGGHKVPVALRAVQRALRRVPRAPPLFVVGTATLTSVEPAGALDARGGGGGGDSGARGRRGGNASLRNMYATSVTLRPPAPTAVGAVVSGGSGGGGSGALGEHAGQAVGSGECAQRRWDKQLSADARAHTLATNLDGLRRALGALWPTARGGAVLSAALRGVGSAATDAVADVAAAPAAADGGGGVGNGGGGGGGGDGGVHALLSARELVPAELHRVAEWALADALMRAAGPERGAADLAGNPRGDRRPAERPSSQPPGAEDAPPSPRPPPRGGGGRGGARGGGAAAGGGAAGGLGALAIEAASVSAAVDVLICAQSEALLAALPAGSNGYGGGSGGGGGGGFSIGGQRGGGAELRATGAGGGGRGGGGGGGGKRCEYEVAIEKLVVPAEAVGVRFADVGALDEAKAALRELVSLPLQQPQLFAVGVSRHCTQGALLSGPPGTGKTMLAKAVATEAGAAFINISMAEITSKWYEPPPRERRRARSSLPAARRSAATVASPAAPVMWRRSH
jgi:hypothetical protein